MTDFLNLLASHKLVVQIVTAVPNDTRIALSFEPKKAAAAAAVSLAADEPEISVEPTTTVSVNTPESATSAEPPKKRGRRSIAQIAADKEAAEKARTHQPIRNADLKPQPIEDDSEEDAAPIIKVNSTAAPVFHDVSNRDLEEGDLDAEVETGAVVAAADDDYIF